MTTIHKGRLDSNRTHGTLRAARGIGTTLHLEKLNDSTNETINSDGTVTLAGKAHLDLYDPDTGLVGMMGHGIIDGLMGHIADLLRRNIDPANCPW